MREKREREYVSERRTNMFYCIHRQNRTEPEQYRLQIHLQFTIYNIIERLRLAETYRNE